MYIYTHKHIHTYIYIAAAVGTADRVGYNEKRGPCDEKYHAPEQLIDVQRWQVLYVYALHVCLTCMPYMYALHVCLTCMPYMYALRPSSSSMCSAGRFSMCMPYVYALYVCLTCVPYI